MVGLNQDNFYLDYNDVFRIDTVGNSSVSITTKSGKRYVFIQTIEKSADLSKVSALVKSNVKDVNKVLPNPVLLLKMIGLILLFIIIFIAVSFLTHPR